MTIWTEEDLEALNAYQRKAPFHPFTCGLRDDHRGNPGILIATQEGWVCPSEGCDYTQEWSHPFMADPHWITCRGGIYHSFGRCTDDTSGDTEPAS